MSSLGASPSSIIVAPETESPKWPGWPNRRAGMAWDDWISSLQWPLQNWPRCPWAIISGSWYIIWLYWILSNLLRHEFTERIEISGAWLKIKVQGVFEVLTFKNESSCDNFFRFSLNSAWGDYCFPGGVFCSQCLQSKDGQTDGRTNRRRNLIF